MTRSFNGNMMKMPRSRAIAMLMITYFGVDDNNKKGDGDDDD